MDHCECPRRGYPKGKPQPSWDRLAKERAGEDGSHDGPEVENREGNSHGCQLDRNKEGDPVGGEEKTRYDNPHPVHRRKPKSSHNRRSKNERKRTKGHPHSDQANRRNIIPNEQRNRPPRHGNHSQDNARNKRRHTPVTPSSFDHPETVARGRSRRTGNRRLVLTAYCLLLGAGAKRTALEEERVPPSGGRASLRARVACEPASPVPHTDNRLSTLNP